ncbi:MAG: helix-turn-helix transcriptional regulator [Spirochaetes bacterium]|nr:helix-turn-helix transcriptional regulator [Spirochaetota bacterium]
MSDLQKYIADRKKRDKGFANGYESGYAGFRMKVISKMLKEIRLRSGITQDVIARKLHTKKSAVSRIENNARDIKLSTLEKYAEACGMELAINIVPQRKKPAHSSRHVVHAV